MGAAELRNKLIDQFNNFLQDESKLDTLSGIFDSINTSPSTTSSLIPESHYKKVEQRRQRFHSGETNGTNWDNLKQQIENKYGF
ncbi:conserved protein of unknown function [Tenacibaculum sp. 190524A02b]|uniref:addiction module protein n=1 Tax=Tenacibaculum vairaonense TaxID=3137860 RepID=UPI0032B16846